MNTQTLTRPWLDVHVYFDLTPAGLAAMEAWRKGLCARFPEMQLYEPVRRPIGPHPRPMFEAHIAPREAGRVMEWLASAEGSPVALVHPHSVDGGLADHTKNARWVRGPLELELRIFDGARA